MTSQNTGNRKTGNIIRTLPAGLFLGALILGLITTAGLVWGQEGDLSPGPAAMGASPGHMTGDMMSQMSGNMMDQMSNMMNNPEMASEMKSMHEAMHGKDSPCPMMSMHETTRN